MENISELTITELKNRARIFEKSGDCESAKLFYEMAIEKGSIRSIILLALMFHKGIGIELDYNRAKTLYESAIEKGSVGAMVNLGQMYCYGLGVEKDYNKAILLFEKASTNNIVGMYNLAILHELGYGVEKDYDRAKNLYEKCVENGYSLSMDRLINLLKKSYFKNNKSDIIEYFCKMNKEEKLKEIYNYDDYDISIIKDKYKFMKEIDELKKEINELKTHIMCSPDGELFFEAKNEWGKLNGNKLIV